MSTSIEGRVRLPLEEAKALYYWAYATTALKKPAWGSGRFRYLNDEQVHRILTDVAATLRDETTKAVVESTIQSVFGDGPAPLAAGCLPEKSANRSDTIAELRKYGPCGEGKAHRELKLLLKAHPEALGLSDVVDPRDERRFISGDRADLVFRHKSQETTPLSRLRRPPPLPGAHQATKYKALLCAEMGWRIDTQRVKAILVAWAVPRELRAFCEKYGVVWQEHHLA